jgi:hypothetical protein
MPLSRLLAQQVARNVQNRGRAYFYSGAVKINDRSKNFIRAQVRGTERYTVELRLEGSRLHASCTCPYAQQYEEPCKHIWATLLKVDAENGMPDAQRRPTLLLKLEIDETYYDEPANGRYSVPARPPTPSTPSRGRHRSRSWKKQIDEVRDVPAVAAPPATWPGGRSILYIIDVPASASRGGLMLDLMVRDRKRNGEWTKPKIQGIAQSQITALPDPHDQRILTALHGAGQVGPYGYWGTNGLGVHQFAISGLLQEELLPALGGTGRLRVRATSDRGDLQQATWDGGQPWEFTLDVVRGDSGKQYVVTGSLRRGEERQPLTRPLLLLPGTVIWPDRIARFEDHGAFGWVNLLQKNGPMVVPMRDKDKLLTELLSLPVLPRLELPEDLRFEEVAVPCRPRLVVKPSTTGFRRDQLEARLTFVYGEKTVPAQPRQRGTYDPHSRRFLLRDTQAEQAADEQLASAGVKPRPDYGYGRHEDVYELSPRNLGRAVRELVEHGWQVEAEGKLYRKPGEFKLSLQSGIDWFDVQAAVDFEGRSVGLPALLEALRRGENTIELDDGTLGMMPEEWLKKYGLLARMGKVEEDKIRFSRAQVGLLDAMLADQPSVSLDQTFIKIRDELRRFERIDPADPPGSFTGALRHYQCDGLGWLRFLECFGFGGCLADDMGLGKTVQVLALLADRRSGKNADRLPSLVVVPRSLIFNWKEEAARFTPHLRVLDHTGIDRSKSADAFAQYDIVLTTYGTMRRDVLLFKEFTFDYCILDESQAIKNASSESAKAARLLRGNHRLALSGTPVENHLGELWSLFEFLNPGMLGQASVFQAGAGRNPDPESRNLLARALRPFILRRTKDQVTPELPAKTEQTLYCDLEPGQRKLYDELRAHYRESLLGRLDGDFRRSKIQVLEALLRLRQAACHPGLIDKDRTDEPSAKLEALLPQLREVLGEDHKALVFSQFTSFLAIVRAQLDEEGVKYEYLDGRTRDRAARVERFQNDPDCKLFLVSLKAGGVGLNLTAAEYVYLLDPWWNPAVEAQAIDRSHRIGQERPVFAYRLIARDTVEEKVLELQKTKRELADAIIGADNSLIRDLKREDLELLLS